HFAGGAAEVSLERRVNALLARDRRRKKFHHRGHGGHREENDETNTAEAGGGGSGVHAGRGAADDLHFDAGGLRGGLPVLPDGATRIDPQFDGGRDCGTSADAAAGNGGGSRKEFKRDDRQRDR